MNCNIKLKLKGSTNSVDLQLNVSDEEKKRIKELLFDLYSDKSEDDDFDEFIAQKYNEQISKGDYLALINEKSITDAAASLMSTKSESTMLEVVRNPIVRLGSYQLNLSDAFVLKENVSFAVQNSVASLSPFLELLNKKIRNCYVVPGRTFSYTKSGNNIDLVIGNEFIVANKIIDQNGNEVDSYSINVNSPVIVCEILKTFKYNSKTHSLSLTVDTDFSINNLMNKIEVLLQNESDVYRKLITTYALESVAAEDQKMRQLILHGKNSLKKAFKNQELYYAQNFIQYHDEYNIHTGDIIKFKRGIIDYVGVVFFDGSDTDIYVAAYDNNGEYANSIKLDSSCLIYEVRPRLFDQNIRPDVNINKNAGGEIVIQRTDGLLELLISHNDIIEIGSKSYTVMDVNGNNVLVCDTNKNISTFTKDYLRSKNAVAYASSEYKFKIDVRNLSPEEKSQYIKVGDRFLNEKNSVYLFTNKTDINAVQYVLLKNSNLNVRDIERFRNPLVSDGEAKDLSYLVNRHIVSLTNLGLKKLYLRQNQSHINPRVIYITPVYDMTGLYILDKSKEIGTGDVLEFAINPFKEGERIPQNANPNLRALVHEIVIGVEGDNLITATFSDSDDSKYTINYRNRDEVKLQIHNVYTHDLSKREASQPDLKLADGIINGATITELNDAVIKTLQKAFGNIPVVFVDDSSESGKKIRGWTDLTAIYINLGYKDGRGKSKPISQTYAHELTHILLAYLRTSNSETYFKMIQHIRDNKKQLKVKDASSYESIEEYIVDYVEKTLASKETLTEDNVVDLFQQSINEAFGVIFGVSNEEEVNLFSEVLDVNNKNVITSLVEESQKNKQELVNNIVNGKILNDSELLNMIMNDLVYKCE